MTGDNSASSCHIYYDYCTNNLLHSFWVDSMRVGGGGAGGGCRKMYGRAEEYAKN